MFGDGRRITLQGEMQQPKQRGNAAGCVPKGMDPQT
jgi:hypothetical protein